MQRQARERACAKLDFIRTTCIEEGVFEDVFVDDDAAQLAAAQLAHVDHIADGQLNGLALFLDGRIQLITIEVAVNHAQTMGSQVGNGVPVDRILFETGNAQLAYADRLRQVTGLLPFLAEILGKVAVKVRIFLAFLHGLSPFERCSQQPIPGLAAHHRGNARGQALLRHQQSNVWWPLQRGEPDQFGLG